MQVILSILKNAEENFIEKDTKNPQIKIITNQNNISISDNGGGIPADIREKIFDPYFSTKDEKNGTTLGLCMSKIIIKNIQDGVCFKIFSEMGSYKHH